MTVPIDIFRALAACTSTVMLLSPIPMILGVWKAKNTGVASIVPLVTMFANSHNYVLYGYLGEHYFPIFATFMLGDVLGLIYIAVFYLYSHEKSKAHRVFLLAGIPLALLTIYAILGGFGVTGQTRHQVSRLPAYVAIVTNLVLYASPFEKVAHVLQHKSAVFINFHMVCAGTFNNTVWIVYTSLTHQWIILIPNALCATMGWIQLVLYFVYHPSTHPYDPDLLPTTATVPAHEVDVDWVAVAVSPKIRTESIVVVRPDSPIVVAFEALDPKTLPLNPQLCSQ